MQCRTHNNKQVNINDYTYNIITILIQCNVMSTWHQQYYNYKDTQLLPLLNDVKFRATYQHTASISLVLPNHNCVPDRLYYKASVWYRALRTQTVSRLTGSN